MSKIKDALGAKLKPIDALEDAILIYRLNNAPVREGPFIISNGKTWPFRVYPDEF